MDTLGRSVRRTVGRPEVGPTLEDPTDRRTEGNHGSEDGSPRTLIRHKDPWVFGKTQSVRTKFRTDMVYPQSLKLVRWSLTNFNLIDTLRVTPLNRFLICGPRSRW